MSSRPRSGIFAGILLLSLLCPIAAIAQRAIANPSFEDLLLPDSSFAFTPEGGLNSWLTSHPVVTGSGNCGGEDCRPIEIWAGPTFSLVSPATGAGNQWAELNAHDASMIYQPVCMTNGESFSYTFLHRGRSQPAIADVMNFRIGIPSGLPTGSKPADLTGFVIAQAETTNNGTASTPTPGVTFAAAGNGWVRYSGSYTYTGASQSVNLGFLAASSAGGIGSGNFIDDFTIALSPYYELNGSAKQDDEGTTGGSILPSNGPGIIVTGTVVAPVTVRMVVNGGTATAGNDYSLSVPFAPGLVTNTVDMVIPAGTYNTSNGEINFPFSVFGDATLESDETIDYSVSLLSGTATLASTASCGATPISVGTYSIVNDDLPVTAANVSISGVVTDLDNGGIRGVSVRLTSPNGARYFAVTNSFGRFTFSSVPAGSDYILQAEAKRYAFDPMFLKVANDLAGLWLTPASK